MLAVGSTIILVTVAWISYLSWKLKSKHDQFFSVFPSPPMPSFFKGHYPVIKAASDRDGHMFNLYQRWTEDLGEVWCRFLFWKPGVIMLSDAGIKDMLVTNGGLPKLYQGALTYFEGLRVTGYGGLIAHVGGHVWLRKRQALEPSFHSKYLLPLLPRINSITDALISKFKRYSEMGETVDMKDEMQLATIDVISAVAFDLDINSVGTENYELGLAHLMDALYHAAMNPTFHYGPFHRDKKDRAKKWIRETRELGHRAITKRREKLERGEATQKDILGHCLHIQEHNPWYTDEDIVDDFLTFFLAGQETTATVLAFALALLARDTRVYNKVAAEVKELMKERDQHLTQEDLSQLPYLECVIKETMRLYPPGSILRRMVFDEGVKVGGYPIPPDTMVLSVPFIQGRLRGTWGEDCREFKPERFEGPCPPKFRYIPFLVGPRRCIGGGLAMMEMKVILSRIIYNFTLAPALNDPVTPVLRMTLCPFTGIKLKLGGNL